MRLQIQLTIGKKQFRLSKGGTKDDGDEDKESRAVEKVSTEHHPEKQNKNQTLANVAQKQTNSKSLAAQAYQLNWGQCYKTFYHDNLRPFNGNTVVLCYKAILP